ncbi:MAG: adenylate/guanylate cyclase domain-containing protein [Actinomycetota bacterium]
MTLGPEAPSDGEPSGGSRTQRRGRRTSVATRLGLAAVVVALVSITVTLGVGLGSGEDVGDDLADERLSAVRGSAVIAVQLLLSDWRSDATILASGPATADALVAFADAYDEIEPPTAQQLDVVTDWYQRELLPELGAARGATPSLSSVLPDSPEALTLQATAIAVRSDGSETDTDDVPIDLSGIDEWLAVSDEFGSFFDQAAQRLDLLDVLLVDSSNRIVYSAGRGPDLGTDLRSGPYGGSETARLSLSVRLAPETGPLLGDIAPYAPIADRPAAAAAAPVVRADGQVVGSLVVVHEGADLDEAVGPVDGADIAPLGRSGQNLVVGADGIVRTDLRAHEESPEEFLDVATENGALDADGAARVEAIGTTATVLELDPAILTAADSSDAPIELTDSVGRRVEAFVADIDDPDLDWRVASQILVAEVDAETRDYRNDVIRISAIGLLVLSLVAVAWANRLIRPVRLIGDRLDRDVDPRELTEAVERGPVEFGRLADDFTVMQDRLDEQRRDVEVADARRRTLLGTLLPSAVSARVEAGDRDVFDRIPSATLVVAVLRGLSEVDGESSLAGGRSRFHAVTSAIDTLAGRHAVERIKIVGDSMLIACGHDRALIDHAPRAVAFAREAVEIVSESGGAGIRAHFAVHTGPVSAGLGGRSRLVYDVWGPTVTDVFLLSRNGGDGAIVVSASTLALLPPDVAGAARPVDPDRSELGWSLDLTTVDEALEAVTGDEGRFGDD